MAKKSWKNKGVEVEQKPQKYSWTNSKVVSTYEDAVSHKSTLKGDRPTKIKRCGVAGRKFVVKVGVPVKKAAVTKAK